MGVEVEFFILRKKENLKVFQKKSSGEDLDLSKRK
jgi:hypothetical protein